MSAVHAAGHWVVTILWPDVKPGQPKSKDYSFSDEGKAINFLRSCEHEGLCVELRRAK